MWGTDSFLNGLEGELLEDFYEESRKILNDTSYNTMKNVTIFKSNS